MALTTPGSKAIVKTHLDGVIDVGDQAQLDKVSEAIAKAINEILLTQMIVTTPGGGGVGTVS